jgi:hypothetical protein
VSVTPQVFLVLAYMRMVKHLPPLQTSVCWGDALGVLGWAWVLNVTLGHKVMASGTAVNRIFLNRELIIFKFQQSSIACHLEL